MAEGAGRRGKAWQSGDTQRTRARCGSGHTERDEGRLLVAAKACDRCVGALRVCAGQEGKGCERGSPCSKALARVHGKGGFATDTIAMAKIGTDKGRASRRKQAQNTLRTEASKQSAGERPHESGNQSGVGTEMCAGQPKDTSLKCRGAHVVDGVPILDRAVIGPRQDLLTCGGGKVMARSVRRRAVQWCAGVCGQQAERSGVECGCVASRLCR